MYVLSNQERAKIISCLCEGVSIRATERLTGHHRNSIMNLSVKVGEGCQRLHDSLMVNLQPQYLELDEIWGFVRKKRRNVTADDPDTYGDIYTFICLDSLSKAIVAWHVGKRTGRNTVAFLRQVAKHVINKPEISTDGWPSYQHAIPAAFRETAHGIVDKKIVILAGGPDSDNYYARETLVEVERRAYAGHPTRISTSYIERANLTLRMGQRRMTRLSNGFSKKFENHVAATAMFFCHYNFVRIHETLRTTPAVHLGVTDHAWSAEELVETALTGQIRRKVGRLDRFHVIQGGKI